MIFKRAVGLGLSLIMTTASLNLAFAAEPRNSYGANAGNDEVVSGAAVEDSVIIPDVTIDDVMSIEGDVAALSSKSDTDVAYAVEGGNIYFDADTGTVTDADESVTSIVIPEIIDEIEVRNISANAFNKCTNLKKITLSDNMENIGSCAFALCSNLESIVVGESNKCYSSDLGILYNKDKSVLICFPANNSAYGSYYSEKKFVVPETVKYIADKAFYGNKTLNKISSYYAQYIGDSAFENCCWLKEAVIENVETINQRAFYNCEFLENVRLLGNVECIMDYAFADCWRLTDISIPYTVTKIGANAFIGCSGIKKLTLPNHLEFIGDSAFEGCINLLGDSEYDNYLTIPYSVKYIGYWAFKDCSSLKYVEIPYSVKEIKSESLPPFYECNNLETVLCYKETIADNKSWYPNATQIEYLDDELSYLQIPYSEENGTYYYNPLGKIVEFEENETYGLNAKTYTLTLPNTINETKIIKIGDEVFGTCSGLTSITIPSSIISIGEDVFEFCDSLTTVYCYKGSTADDYSLYPDGVEISYIGDITNEKVSCEAIGGYFYFNKSTGAIVGADSGITSAVIPESIDGVSVTAIESNVFSECTALASITIPDSVTVIGENAIADTATIYCSRGSYAETYAKENNISYKNTDVNHIENGVYNIVADGEVNIDETSNAEQIVVADGVNVDITICNFNSDSLYDKSVIDIGKDANVNLYIEGYNKLISNQQCAGIYVGLGSTLTIDGSGTLEVHSELGCAIGGSDEDRDYNAYACGDYGNIIINGGTVIAESEYGAGIGGTPKWSQALDGSGIGENTYCLTGSIIINGGNITAKGGESSAGIGGTYDYEGLGDYIAIYGGIVNAYGGEGAAGIGYAKKGTSLNRNIAGDIRIYGGVVNAYGGNNAPGIGRGAESWMAPTVEIYGGIVNSYGGNNADGIDLYPSQNGGLTENDGWIEICGGTVTAVGCGDDKQGINSRQTWISGGSVKGASKTVENYDTRKYVILNKLYAPDVKNKTVKIDDRKIDIPDNHPDDDYIYVYAAEDETITITDKGSVIKGDINGDEKVTAVDAMLIAQLASGRRTDEVMYSKADINGDGKVTAVDAMLVARYASGRISDL